MTKQEMLTKLAIECPTWYAARSDLTWHNFQVSDEEGLQIDEEELLAERERLLNKPSWSDAPENATHLAVCPHGVWRFFESKPGLQDDTFGKGLVNMGGVQTRSNYTIAIPAGYDWKESLEERPV